MRRIVLITTVLVFSSALASAAPQPAPVTVVNPASAPVPVTGRITVNNTVPQAIQLHCYAECLPDQQLCECRFPAIPSGKLLVIETISLMGTEYAQAMYHDVQFETSVNGSWGYYNLPVVIQRSSFGMTDFTVLTNIRLYADSESTPRLMLGNTVADTILNAYLSGYYLDKP